MCVVVAMKLPRDPNTGKPTNDAKWRLAKIRDRNYDAEYHVRRYTVKEHGASQLFLIDGDTDWTEGVSVKEDGFFLSMINSALNNYADKKDGKSKGSSSDDSVSKNGYAIRKALKQKNIDLAAEVIKENKIDGCNLLTDGDRLIVIETTLPLEVKDKYRDVKNGKRFEDIVPVEEYATVVKEIKDDFLVVRTNNGILDKSFGYKKDDGESFESSIRRRKYAEKIIREKVYNPLDLIVEMSKMGRDEIDDNPYYRPLRVKEKILKLKDVPTIYSSVIIQIDPSGTMIVKPIECKFNINNASNLISDKYKTHLVILPHRTRMFESFREYLDIKSLKLL